MIDFEEKVQKLVRRYEKKQIRLIEKLGRDLRKNERECNLEVRKLTKVCKFGGRK